MRHSWWWSTFCFKLEIQNSSLCLISNRYSLIKSLQPIKGTEKHFLSDQRSRLDEWSCDLWVWREPIGRGGESGMGALRTECNCLSLVRLASVLGGNQQSVLMKGARAHAHRSGRAAVNRLGALVSQDTAQRGRCDRSWTLPVGEREDREAGPPCNRLLRLSCKGDQCPYATLL